MSTPLSKHSFKSWLMFVATQFFIIVTMCLILVIPYLNLVISGKSPHTAPQKNIKRLTYQNTDGYLRYLFKQDSTKLSCYLTFWHCIIRIVQCFNAPLAWPLAVASWLLFFPSKECRMKKAHHSMSDAKGNIQGDPGREPYSLALHIWN
jgi:hypothetical protein